MLVVAAIICSCSKLAPVCEPAYVYASFDVSMDNTTKATIDGDGAAGHVNRCVLQIWKGDEIYKTVVRTAPAGTREYSFKGVTLDPECTYDFLFWADCGTAEGGDLYYSTESLKSVRMLCPEGCNNDAADAFCNRISGCTIDSVYETELILRRPLAQLNVIAADLPQIEQLPLCEEFRPQSVSYSYSACTGFDVLEGKTVGEAVAVSVTDAPVYGVTTQDGMRTLAMTYLFPQDGDAVVGFDLAVRNENGTVVTGHVDNLPLKINWRTNVIGNLLTVKGGFSVSVVPMFDGETSVL